MATTTRMLPALLLCGSLLAQSQQPASPAPAASTPADGIEGGLARVRVSMNGRNWKDAEDRIRALLIEHKGEPALRPHLQGLRQDLQRAMFWRTIKEPLLTDLVSGELLEHSPLTGQLRIRYTPTRLADFQEQGASRVHPVQFAGPWSVEIEGTPAEVTNVASLILMTPQQGYAVETGSRIAGASFYSMHRITELPLSASSPPKTAAPIEVKTAPKSMRAKIDVDKQEIRLWVDGRRMLTQAKPELWGRFGLQLDRAGPAFGRITLSGRTENGWVQGLFDAKVSAQLAAFTAKWQDPLELEAFREAGPAAPESSSDEIFSRLRFLLEVPRDRQGALDEFDALLGKGRAKTRAVLETLDREAAAGAPGLAAYMRFRCAMELDLPTRALTELAHLRVAEGQQGDLELLRACLLRSAGQMEAAVTALAALEAKAPSAQLYGELAESLLLLGRLDEAQAAVQRGLALAPSSASLGQLDARVVKARKGPPWKKPAECKSALFTVGCDGDAKLAKDALAVLDAAWARLAAFLGPLPRPPAATSTVLLFAGQGTYTAYVAQLADHSTENTLGVYHQQVKQIVAWNQPSVSALWQTLRHECVHRYLDLQIGPRVPRWLNEGLAEAFASCWNEKGKFGEPQLKPEWLARLGQGQRMPGIVEFMHWDAAAFGKDIETSYAWSWALVHFLRADEEGGKALGHLLDGLRAGQDPHAAIDQAFSALGQLRLLAMTVRLNQWLRHALAGAPK